MEYTSSEGDFRNRYRTLAIYAILAIAGAALLDWTRRLEITAWYEVIAAGIGLLLGLIKPFTAAVMRFSNWLDGLSPRKHRRLVGVLVIILPLHFLFAAWRGDRPLIPLMHDEQMYLLQARQLASGHLAMPALPLGEFFDTFYILIKPVYASMYFPGTALAYVPSIWLRLPFFTWPLLIMTLLYVMTYLVAARILSRFLGLVVIFAMLATGPMAWMPTATMSHPLGGLFGMTIIYAWLRWRANPRIVWAILLGAASGWMAITRPMEMMAFGLPILIAIVGSTRRSTLGLTLHHGGLAFACALPFISLQLITNHVVTGHWAQLPISLYVQQEFPEITAMGSGDPGARSNSTLPEKQAMMRAFITPQLRSQALLGPWVHLRGRTIMMLTTGLSSPLLFVLLPFSFPLLRRVEICVLWGIFVCFSIVYVIYGTYTAQYSAQILAILSLLAVSGATHMKQREPLRVFSLFTAYVCFVVLVTSVVLVTMPTSGIGKGDFDWSVMRFNYEVLPDLVKKPALVMMRYGEHSSPFVEPVYNLEAAWPDDCPVIRAHDFGPQRDLPLFRYYAGIQPSRNVYLYDRDSGNLHSLGRVGDIVQRAQPATPTTQK